MSPNSNLCWCTFQQPQILVEYDDVEWQRREWICPHKDGLFHLFMVEQVLVWANRRDPFSPSHGSVLWPSLTFSALVSTVNIPSHLQPIEFLVDHNLAFKDYKQLKPYQNWDRPLPGVKDYPELKLAVKRWTELQDGQRILLTTPSVLVGYRVEVYRAEGTTQWYTAVIIGYNEATRRSGGVYCPGVGLHNVRARSNLVQYCPYHPVAVQTSGCVSEDTRLEVSWERH
ncbi:unnamed protein product [Diabrotica balteata]|uniref:JmjC domain-containing histone demethylation protein 2C n=1 Tax=Diabrotica balteata TaxID=107213 RepID=A0A9N9T371_DIABA|nr:unnamed protein product [Diabrotica balteata]